MTANALPKSVEEMTDIIDIEGLWHSSFVTQLKSALIILGVLLAVALLLYGIKKIYLHYKNKRAGLMLTPDARALKDLKQLTKAGFLEARSWDLYYFSLDEILRRYINDRFNFNILDKTYEEIKNSLHNPQTGKSFVSGLSNHVSRQMQEFWAKAQFIKFAKQVTTGESCAADYKFVEQFVLTTKEEIKGPEEKQKK